MEKKIYLMEQYNHGLSRPELERFWFNDLQEAANYLLEQSTWNDSELSLHIVDFNNNSRSELVRFRLSESVEHFCEDINQLEDFLLLDGPIYICNDCGKFYDHDGTCCNQLQEIS